ncbi:hypothetical protein PCC6912_40050 [Chlorogloeopsis fritschii PCC 6912]|uniref:Uncharacterized protein n=1 Tax=Chlorogloeopsis fritschii PCC 6912 TaxID=211165 RepID=A0A3S0XUD6_CHLFR|nr:hypothetical protein [Chlorogloeopsis fritschii]RUR77046.1 hypothetical protein PCC6912_40050 [Chlorogloeopsis fritschii PCC 6912]
MNELRKLLESEGIAIANLEELVTQMGFDPNNLSEGTALAIAESIIQKEKSKSSKITKTKGKKLAKTTASQTGSLEPAIEQLRVKSGGEINEMILAAATIKNQVSSAAAEQVLNEFYSIPTEVVRKVGEGLVGYQGEPDFFRQTITGIGTAAFSDLLNNATE